MRQMLGAASVQPLETRTMSGQGEVTVEGAHPGLPPAALTAEGGAFLEREGSFGLPYTPIFVGEVGVFRSNSEFCSYQRNVTHNVYFNASGIGEVGWLFLRLTLGAPCAGVVSVSYGNLSGEVEFSEGSVAGDIGTLLLPLGRDSASVNRIQLSCSNDMNFRLTVCRSDETDGKRLTILALDEDGAISSMIEGEVQAPLRAIPNGTADLLLLHDGVIRRRIGECVLTGEMLTETVPTSIGGIAPSFLLSEIAGRDAAEPCLFTHGGFSSGSGAWESGEAPGLYASGGRLYLSIPYGMLDPGADHTPEALLAAARGWAEGFDARIWYALDEEHQTSESIIFEQRLRLTSERMTLRIVSEAEPRLITLSAYYRKEV